MRNAVVCVSYDGIISHYCGVGSITLIMSKCLDIINKEAGCPIDYFLISSGSNKRCIGYSKTIKKENFILTKRNGGKIIYINSSKNKDNQFGSLSQWKKNSVEVYKILDKLSKDYCKLLVFLHDAPFAGVANYALSRRIKNIYFIWIPHSTGYIHGKNILERKKRIAWERQGIIKKRQFFVGYISDYMRKHLKTKYRISDVQLINLKNGVFLGNDEKKHMSKSSLIKLIPSNKKLVLSLGRSEPYKNLKVVLRASKFLNNKIFLLLIASDRTSDNPQHNLLNKEAKNIPNCVLIPHYILQAQIEALIKNRQTLIIVPSKKEPFGLIPCEVRLWGKDNGSLVLASKCDGLKEQINDRKDGFFIRSFNVKELATQIEHICSLRNDIKQKISKRAYSKILKEYNYKQRLIDVLALFFNF